MSELRPTMSVPLAKATSGITMTIKVKGVRWFKVRSSISLLIIKLATLISPIVTRIDIE